MIKAGLGQLKPFPPERVLESFSSDVASVRPSLRKDRVIRRASDFFKQMIGERSSFSGNASFHLAMKVIRNVSELNHLGHVMEPTYYVEHMSTEGRRV
jgi:hypothetical protein